MTPAELTQASLSLLSDLVSFNSVSSQSNLPLLEYVEKYLDSQGVWHTRVPAPEGPKSNLIARIGPDVAGGIVLSGHTDVVPVVGQPWESDPFTLTRKGGRLYGRGTADMKSFLAVCLAMIPHWKTLSLSRPLWLAFSYDEEVGCLGVPHLLSHMMAKLPRPAFAVIGEPTLMQVVTAHKGVLSFETTVTGHEWHSSQPHLGANAVHAACSLVHFLSAIAKEISETGQRDPRFDPPYTTVHVGTIHGGTARNIIPRECSFHWEIRPLPGDNHQAIIERFEQQCRQLEAPLKHASAEAGIRSRPISRMMGVTLPQHAADFRATVMRCAQTNSEHAVSFGTEAGVFNDNGIPAIICGPGDIQQAHKPNEFIAVEQVEACVSFMLRLPSDAGMTTT